LQGNYWHLHHPSRPPRATPTETAECDHRIQKAVAEVTESIAFASAVIFLSAISAQKSLVKPQNHSTIDKSTTSEWHFSYVPTAILNIEIKEEAISCKALPDNLLKISILAATHLL
jgi:hypothetical protein